MDDDNIVPLLLRLQHPTLLTRDGDFFDRRLVHARYGLAWFQVEEGETAFYIRRFLAHPLFRTNRQRLGKVMRIHPRGIDFWAKNATELASVQWL
jgi:hypothetical protein